MSLRAFKKSRFLFLMLVVLVTGGWLIFGRSGIKKLDHPEYLSFTGSYVISVPKDMAVDAHAIVDMQLVYSGSITGKTLDEVYDSSNIGIQPIAPLKDAHSADSFKKYVNETFVPEAKQKLSSDVVVKFDKQRGWDVASVSVKKDGKPYRFIYLKNGKHPVAIVSKEQTESFKKIEQSITDVEKTDLKNEAEKLKQATQTIAQQIRDKKAKELYAAAAPELKSKNTEDQIAKLLAAEEVYSQGTVIINGGSYNSGEFGAVIYFVPLNTDFKPASGAMYFKKIDNQWKLKGMQLPNPIANQVKS